MEGTLDLILIALPYDLPGTERMELFRDEFRLAARPDTKLIDPEHYRFDRLNAGSVLLLREGHCLREHALEACKLRNSDSLNSFSASSLLTLIEMVDADLGITYLPEMSVDSALLQRTQVMTYPLPEPSYRTIGLAWRRGSARESEFRMLGEFVRALGRDPDARLHASTSGRSGVAGSTGGLHRFVP
jgi:LysR family hydrogen peroxide-inducible transcriptional activator